MRKTAIVLGLVGAALSGLVAAGASASPAGQELRSLEGSWVMESAYEIRADGTRVTGYGSHPKGLLLVDKAGRYSLQIFRPDRPKFAAGSKPAASADEIRAAVLGSSTHFGTVALDRVNHRLTFAIEGASFPNWEGQRQQREYSYARGVLHYAVPASASGDGTVAHSVWRKLP